MSNLKKYSAKLLFQHRIEINGVSDKMRRCEESIIVLEAKNARDALKMAKQDAKKRETSSKNDQYSKEFKCECIQHFEFIGISDLLQLGIECQDNEVWYDVKTRLNPMERKDSFIPNEEDLNAIINENNSSK